MSKTPQSLAEILTEGIISDGSFEVWHVQFGDRALNVIGSRELLLQLMCRDPKYRAECERKKPIVRWINVPNMPTYTGLYLAIHVSWACKTGFITAEEREWLVTVLKIPTKLVERE